jgi:hypothetical protein
MTPSPAPEWPQKHSPVVKHDIHALLVAADLLRQGFAVFRKVRPASPCDFVIMRGRQCWRVMVRTARYSVRPYPRGRPEPRLPPDPERFDVLAYVLPDGVIRYEPPLEPPGEPGTGTVTTS